MSGETTDFPPLQLHSRLVREHAQAAEELAKRLETALNVLGVRSPTMDALIIRIQSLREIVDRVDQERRGD